MFIEEVVTTEYGVQYGPTMNDIRWDPTYGGFRPQEPYTLDEATEDAKRNNLRIVKRTRIEYVIEDSVTDWEYA